MNGVFRITIDVQFSEELFFCCSTVDCLHLLVIVLLCVFGNGNNRVGIPRNGNKT